MPLAATSLPFHAGLVSVIIPCYKQAQFLATAIDSVLTQTHGSTQVIVVNDGSPDDTASVARRYGDRITYLERSNGGLSAARNTGLAAATGEFVQFLDADDYLAPDMHANSIAMHRRQPHVAGTYCSFARVDATGVMMAFMPRRQLSHTTLPQKGIASMMDCAVGTRHATPVKTAEHGRVRGRRGVGVRGGVP